MLNEALRRQAPDGDAGPVRRAYELQIPLGRVGRAEEAAAAIAWLCSSKSSYMAGVSVVLDGGLIAIAR